MARNQIGDDGFEDLFASLEKSAKSGRLREIDISDNQIEKTPTVNALTELMTHLVALISLNIEKLDIGKIKQ